MHDLFRDFFSLFFRKRRESESYALSVILRIYTYIALVYSLFDNAEHIALPRRYNNSACIGNFYFADLIYGCGSSPVIYSYFGKDIGICASYTYRVYFILISRKDLLHFCFKFFNVKFHIFPPTIVPIFSPQTALNIFSGSSRPKRSIGILFSILNEVAV